LPEPDNFSAVSKRISSSTVSTPMCAPPWPAAGEPGHAVAVHWHPKDFFLLLDPNYGMFIHERLAGAKSVNAALNYLFGKAYPAEPGLRVLNDIDYEIFAKREGRSACCGDCAARVDTARAPSALATAAACRSGQ
jgi:hypothetical protein